MKFKTKMLLLKIYTYIVRVLLSAIALAIQVAVLVGVVWLIMNLCSCSSSRHVATETVATESMIALETAKDSVNSNLELQTSTSGYLEISDMSILFYPPSDIQSSPVPEDSVAPGSQALQTPQRPKILYPALLNIGRLSTGTDSNTALQAEDSRLKTEDSSISHHQSTKDSVQRIRDPTKPSWPVMLSLFMALLIIIYTGFMLYRTNRP